MYVQVICDPAVRYELVKLLEPRSPEPADAVRFGMVFMSDIEDQFRRHLGAPPDAERVEDENGVVWWWKYIAGLWVLFTVRDRPGRYFGGRRRTVRVIGFEAGPPPPGATRSAPGP